MKTTENGARGERIAQAKLTAAAVAELRRRYRAGDLPVPLAREFGVHPGTVWQALIGRTWAHVSGAIPKGERNRSGRQPGQPVNYRRGEEHGKSKLTEAKVIEARRLSAQGVRHAEISRRMGLCHSTISDAVQGVSWRHIPMEPEPAISPLVAPIVKA
jgi:hypothetical protein